MTCCNKQTKNSTINNRDKKVKILEQLNSGINNNNQYNGNLTYNELSTEWASIKTTKPTEIITDSINNIFVVKTHIFYFQYNSNTKILTTKHILEHNNIKYNIDSIENYNENNTEIKILAHVKLNV